MSFSYKDIRIGITYFGRRVVGCHPSNQTSELPYSAVPIHTSSTVTYVVPHGRRRLHRCTAASFARWVRQERKTQQSCQTPTPTLDVSL